MNISDTALSVGTLLNAGGAPASRNVSIGSLGNFSRGVASFNQSLQGNGGQSLSGSSSSGVKAQQGFPMDQIEVDSNIAEQRAAARNAGGTAQSFATKVIDQELTKLASNLASAVSNSSPEQSAALAATIDAAISNFSQTASQAVDSETVSAVATSLSSSLNASNLRDLL
jgi:hypothetical protein